MDFHLTREQELVRQMMHDFNFNPHATYVA